MVDTTYPQLIERAEAAELVELVGTDGVIALSGELVVQSAFAVPKNEVEGRWISCNEFVNAVVDPRKMLKMRLPYMPQLRGVTTQRGKRLVLSKRDARHYFHALQNGPKWRRFLSLPAVRQNGLKRIPVARAWPMGFRNSAIIAQRVTDVAAAAAGLPEERRVLLGGAVPLEPPLWATCLDDFVALHYDDGMHEGGAWAPSFEAAWDGLGVATNVSKTLNGARAPGNAGVPGRLQ